MSPPDESEARRAIERDGGDVVLGDFEKHCARARGLGFFGCGGKERACQASSLRVFSRAERKDLAFVGGNMNQNKGLRISLSLNTREHGKGTRSIHETTERVFAPALLEASAMQ